MINGAAGTQVEARPQRRVSQELTTPPTGEEGGEGGV